MNTTVIWKMPVPSTALVHEPELKEQLGRDYELWFSYEGAKGIPEPARLIFKGIETLKITYISSCTVDWIENCYDKLVQVLDSGWLREVHRTFDPSEIGTLDNDPKSLAHYAICFDDGPLYEFICRSVETSEADPRGPR